MRAIDLFCGAGGSSWGARKAGAEIVAGLDAWGAAADAYAANFRGTTVFRKPLEDVDPASVKRRVGKVELILASPECTSHSHARGAAARCDRSRETAFQVLRFARAFEPRWLVVENVVTMRAWSRYEAFLEDLRDLGYTVCEQVLNSADFGVPQRRRRLFLVCDKEGDMVRVEATHKRAAPASRIIEVEGKYPVSLLRSGRRASATLERAERAIGAVGDSDPFLLVYYGSDKRSGPDKRGGWQRLSEPLRTITTRDRFALVMPNDQGHVMRMLQVPELKKAMGMPARFSVGNGTRREQMWLIGNAVCPPVMAAIVSRLTSGPKRQ